ncbi:MAG: metallophosphoesterase [candidate division KSB1 bacterium]|nr:metallophosphoesterase [candidate division KSB1 bacterium]
MKRVVVVSDLHVGSRVAVADTRIVRCKDSSSRVREALFERWMQAVEAERRPDVLIVCGDTIEGQNRKKSGCGLWTSDILEQCEHAVHLLQMFKGKQIFIVRGSDYHVSVQGLPAEEVIARRLGAVECPGQSGVPKAMRDRSSWEWYIEVGGVVFHAAHRIGVSKVFHYQSTPNARQLLQAKLNDRLRHSRRRIQVVLRGHAHYFNAVMYSGSAGFILPCWKGYDEYLLHEGPLDLSPDIGYLVFYCEDGKWQFEKHLTSVMEIQPAPLYVCR